MDTDNELLDLMNEAAEATKPSLDGLGRASALAQTLQKLELQHTALLEEAAELAKQIAKLSEQDIPALFDELKMREVTLSNGRTLSLKNIYVGKIPEDKKDDAYEWLEDHGHGDVVKTKVEAQFGMGELETAKKLAKELEAKGFIVNAGRSVHASTLGKLVKTVYMAGGTLPSELFTPNVLRRAQLK